MIGIIPVKKEAGMTSHDVVARLRRILKTRKVGHSGTLDPMATGVLTVFIGRATKFIELTKHDFKSYEARMKLGLASDTLDIWGEITAYGPVPTLSLGDIEALFEKFTGDLLQQPPMYSALKKDGKKLYELARKGIEVERPFRPITIKELSLLSYDGDEVTFRVTCSRGTYIRSLIDDMAKSLGTLGVMTSLVRTENEGFTYDEAHTLTEIQAMVELGEEGFLHSLDQVTKDLSAIEVSQEVYHHLKNGVKVNLARFITPIAQEKYRVLYQGKFVGIATEKDGTILVDKMV